MTLHRIMLEEFDDTQTDTQVVQLSDFDVTFRELEIYSFKQIFQGIHRWYICVRNAFSKVIVRPLYTVYIIRLRSLLYSVCHLR